jgi:alkylation response protein AidB-like acyl-CoA dehydrogenase
MLERLLGTTVQYARQRRQFRRPIGRHQALAHRIARMKIALDSARLLVHRAAWLLDRDQDATAESAAAKVAVSEAAIACTLDAVHVHGALGIMRSTGLEQCVRDAVPASIFSGTTEIQLDAIARSLGL